MATPTSFRDLRVWQNAMQLAVDIYHLAGNLPPTERPGLSTNLQHAATVIPTVIANGHKTRSKTGMVTACRQALATCTELETLLGITGQLYPNVPSNDLIDQLDEVQEMLQLAIKRLSSGPVAGPRKTV
jgi:four helix bundle protein